MISIVYLVGGVSGKKESEVNRGRERFPSTAVILAAGMGSRLLPHTDHTPKPLLQFNEKPVLGYIFESLIQARIKKVILVIHHLEEKIIQYADQNFNNDVDLVFCHQPALTGTITALQHAGEKMKNDPDRYFLVLAADHLLPLNHITDLTRFHTSGSQEISVSVRKIHKTRTSQANITLLDDAANIVSIIEKPDIMPEADYCHSAYLIYILPFTIFNDLHRISMSKRGEYELPEAVNTGIGNGLSVRAFVVENFPNWEKHYAKISP